MLTAMLFKKDIILYSFPLSSALYFCRLYMKQCLLMVQAEEISTHLTLLHN